MSTAIERRPRTITVGLVRDALAATVARNPDRTDRRIADHLAPRYLDHGQPTCLVAHLLVELGYPATLLRDLDRERAVGNVSQAGVRIADSRHPALRRFTGNATALMQFLQSRQDAGYSWNQIAHDAFRPARFGRGFDERKRPWLY